MLKKLQFKGLIYALSLIILLPVTIYINYNAYRKTHAVPLRANANERDYVKVFSDIYINHDWGVGSGVGSDPQNAAPYMSLLQRYLDDPRFTTIVDLGCGDWQLMRTINIPANKTYIGYDVVEPIISTNIANFASDNVRFYHTSSLEEFATKNISGDLLIIKDVMQHWPQDQIEYFLANVLPHFKYALITNQYIVQDKRHNNANVRMGPVHSVGLLEPPFALKNAEVVLEYDGPDHKQVLFYQNPN